MNIAKRAICLDCEKQPCLECDTQPHGSKLIKCSECGEGLPFEAYDLLLMQTKMKAGANFVQCMECMDESEFVEPRNWLHKTAYKCAGPGCVGKVSQPQNNFSRQMQCNQHFAVWKCEECRRPTCARCHSRETSAVICAWSPPFECMDCKYPPCTMCGVSRPRKSRRAENLYKEWTCTEWHKNK